MYPHSQFMIGERHPCFGSIEDHGASLNSASDAHIRQLNGFITDILPLLREYASTRTADPTEIATLLNYRGMPCYGQSKWTGTFVRMILARDRSGQGKA
ncbi:MULTISPECIES: hypothetical protein [unclassified Xanthobacter]|uniref:hypothetical protein n=1 Tax=unclassified Xanthobacter TaxID=2623496 RepID=UPI001F2AED02|nr:MULTISPECIES: hypothetical protein [unclassified Xanthobacter]